MRKAACFFSLASLFAMVIAACGDDDDSWIPKQDAGVDGSALDAAQDAPKTDGCIVDASVARIDCTKNNSSCPPLVPVGEDLNPDGSATSIFHGASDPSIRQDPTSQRIWLVYSYPRVQSPIGAFVSESHLAYSDDFGQTFIYDTINNPMFAAPAYPADAEAGTPVGAISSESASIVRGQLSGGQLWYVARSAYIARPTAGFDPQPNSLHFRVSAATDPTSFHGQSPDVEQTLGLSHGGATPVDVDLANVAAGALADCTQLNDPGVYFDSGKLYLAAQCVSNAAKDRVVIFSTVPTGAAKTWVWGYVGVLADLQVTRDVVTQLALDPDVTGLHQTDLARGRDGKLLAILSPTKTIVNDPSYTGGRIHIGCAAIEMTSIDPPVFARDCNGKLSIRAYATASDEPNGQSSCGYDPSSATGMLLSRRPDGTGTDAGKTGFSLQKTGLNP